MENFFPRFLQGLIIISLIGLAMTFFFEGKYELPMGVSGIELFIDKQKEAKEKVVNSDDKQLVQKPDWKLGKEFFENKNWLELERHSKFLIQEKGKNAVINHIHYFLSLLFQGKQHEAKEYLNAEGNRKWKFSENYDFEYVVYSVLKFYATGEIDKEYSYSSKIYLNETERKQVDIFLKYMKGNGLPRTFKQ